MDILQIENLRFRYPDRGKEALDGVSLPCARRGNSWFLCGGIRLRQNHAAENAQAGAVPHGEKSGRIVYNGVEQAALDDRTAACDIGYVLQNPENQVVTDKVWHELAFGLESLGFPTGTIRRRVAEMASYFGIQTWFRQNTGELSGGQKQMLNLASVMVMQPQVLILDEPTSQRHPIAASDFIGTLRKLTGSWG